MNRREREAVVAIHEAIQVVRMPTSNATSNIAGMQSYCNEMRDVRLAINSVLLPLVRESYGGELEDTVGDLNAIVAEIMAANAAEGVSDASSTQYLSSPAEGASRGAWRPGGLAGWPSVHVVGATIGWRDRVLPGQVAQRT